MQASDGRVMYMRLQQTMRTDSFLKLIRQTPIRHYDKDRVKSVRNSTSSNLYLQIGNGAKLLPSVVNAKGYYTFPQDAAISEACVKLPQNEVTYELVLELCRILAQSREGYFECDHLCAKSLPMLMMVLENDGQAEQFKEAVSLLEMLCLLLAYASSLIVYTTSAGSSGARQLSLSSCRARSMAPSSCLLPCPSPRPRLCPCVRQASRPRRIHGT